MQANHEVDWTAGDLCLARAEVEEQLKWNRGRITAVKSVTEYEVFLIDVGVKRIVGVLNLIALPDHYLHVRPQALMLHIADAVPTCGDSWALSSIDVFKDTMKYFERKEISIVGDTNEHGSIPVILWGVTYEQFNTMQQAQYHNIFEYLQFEGYADRNSKMTREQVVRLERIFLEDEFGWNILAPEEHSPNDSDETIEAPEVAQIGHYAVELSPCTIKAWIPAEATNSKAFSGTPTAVDEDGFIYISNKEQQTTLNQLNVLLFEFYLTQPDEALSIEPEIEQPVVVQSNMDKGERNQLISYGFNIIFRFRLLSSNHQRFQTRRLHSSASGLRYR